MTVSIAPRGMLPCEVTIDVATPRRDLRSPGCFMSLIDQLFVVGASHPRGGSSLGWCVRAPEGPRRSAAAASCDGRSRDLSRHDRRRFACANLPVRGELRAEHVQPATRRFVIRPSP
jgi:hypothetical protein